MPPINVLVKPASSACNMRCKYCFYEDEAAKRSEGFRGIMSLETAGKLIRSASEFAQDSCCFMFQGGEPTLAGIDFYRSFIEIEKDYVRNDLSFSHSIQTNGYALDEEWVKFFKDNGFFVGVSLDGSSDLHDLNRSGKNGSGSFNKVMKSINLLRKYGVEFNILSVVTSKGARSAEKTYNFFKKQGLYSLQFIDCLDPFGEQVGLSASNEDYADFLTKIFRLWFNDFKRGEYVSIRHLDNWLGIILGGVPEACNMCGRCSIQFVVEGDGSVYPCDFYALDEYMLGRLGESTFEQIVQGDAAQSFIAKSLAVPDECGSCRWYPLCRNGCRRERELLPDSTYGRTRRCGAYKHFFEENERELAQAVQMIARQNGKV